MTYTYFHDARRAPGYTPNMKVFRPSSFYAENKADIRMTLAHYMEKGTRGVWQPQDKEIVPTTHVPLTVYESRAVNDDGILEVAVSDLISVTLDVYALDGLRETLRSAQQGALKRGPLHKLGLNPLSLNFVSDDILDQLTRYDWTTVHQHANEIKREHAHRELQRREQEKGLLGRVKRFFRG
jgi:hypothetical protein